MNYVNRWRIPVDSQEKEERYVRSDATNVKAHKSALDVASTVSDKERYLNRVMNQCAAILQPDVMRSN